MRRLFFFLAGCLLVAQLRAAPGDLDQLDLNLTSGSDGYVDATALQPDGKIIVAGHFDSILGVSRHDIARLNPNGTLDLAFNPEPRFGANSDFDYVTAVAVQPDGKVLLSGFFDQLQPNGALSATARSYVARLNADGTLDTTFDPNPNGAVSAMLVQADGKVLVAGNFTTVRPNGAALAINRQHIARLNPDGSVDLGFDPRANDFVNSMAEQADGQLLIGGGFITLQPNGAATTSARRRIARLQSDGTIDSGFDPNANGVVDCVTVQADGKILLGGNFTTLQPNNAPAATTRNRIARLNADGSLEPNFNPGADSRIKSIALQANGKILLGGFFGSLNFNTGALVARQFIGRLAADGTVESEFDPKPDSEVLSLGLQADGRALLGGLFVRLQPNGAASATARGYFARLLNEPATQVLSAPDAAHVLWERGGSTPELARASFELSTNGGTSWTLLGLGQRVAGTANWQSTGLSLPVNALLRARGITPGSYQNGSTGLLEQTIGLGPDSDNDGLLDSWELRYWTSIFGHGALDDSDGDGLPDLLEEAFDLNPTKPDSASIPRPVIEARYLTITITKQAGVNYQVQTAGTLLSGQPNSFSSANTTVLIDTGTTLKVRENFLIGDGPGRFMRVQVTAAP